MVTSAPVYDDPIARVEPDRPAKIVTEKKKVRNIQSLRGIAALSVVLFHLLFIERKYGNGTSVLPSWFSHGFLGVDLFFVISGFVMVTVTRGKFGGFRSSSRFLYQRATRIYPLYWCYTFVVLAVYWIAPSIVNSAQENQFDLVASLLLLPDRYFPLLVVGWSLVHEVYFYLVFGVLLWLCNERQLPFAMLIWLLLVAVGNVSAATLPPDTSPTITVITHPMTFEFIAGCLIGLAIYRWRPRLSGTAVTFGVLLLALVSVFPGLLGGLNLEDGWARIVVFGIPSALLVYGAVGLEFTDRVTMPSWMERIGDASYSIYLSHVLVLSALGRVWWMTGWNGIAPTSLILLGSFFAVLAFGLASYSWLELPLLKLFRRQNKASGI